jgi:hypothetical protein
VWRVDWVLCMLSILAALLAGQTVSVGHHRARAGQNNKKLKAKKGRISPIRRIKPAENKKNTTIVWFAIFSGEPARPR